MPSLEMVLTQREMIGGLTGTVIVREMMKANAWDPERQAMRVAMSRASPEICSL